MRRAHVGLAQQLGVLKRMNVLQKGSLESSVKTERLRSFIVLVVYFIAALVFTRIYFDSTREWRQAPLELLSHFAAEKPFQYRVLFPFLVHVVQMMTGLPVYDISKIINVLVTLALLVVFRNYLGLFFSKYFSPIGALLILYPMYWHYCVYGFWRTTSDLPATLFFLLGLKALFNRRWKPYYLIYSIGAINRETIVFLTIAFSLVLSGKKHLRFIASNVLIQVLILAAVRYGLAQVFSTNAGESFQLQLFSNLQKISSLEIIQPILLSFGGLWIFIPFGWHGQDPFVKRLLWVCLPFYLLMAVVGNLHELRVYNELVPLVTTSALYGIKGVVTYSRPNSSHLWPSSRN
jgi:hypothetical protein